MIKLEDNNIRETYSEGCKHMLTEGKEIRDRLMIKVHERVEG